MCRPQGCPVLAAIDMLRTDCNQSVLGSIQCLTAVFGHPMMAYGLCRCKSRIPWTSASASIWLHIARHEMLHLFSTASLRGEPTIGHCWLESTSLHRLHGPLFCMTISFDMAPSRPRRLSGTCRSHKAAVAMDLAYAMAEEQAQLKAVLTDLRRQKVCTCPKDPF